MSKRENFGGTETDVVDIVERATIPKYDELSNAPEFDGSVVKITGAGTDQAGTYFFNKSTQFWDGPVGASGSSTDRTVIENVSADFVTSGEDVLLVDSTNVPIQITLSTDDNTKGVEILIKDDGGNAGSNAITIVSEGSTVDSMSSFELRGDYQGCTVFSNGNEWLVTRDARRPRVEMRSSAKTASQTGDAWFITQ